MIDDKQAAASFAAKAVLIVRDTRWRFGPSARKEEAGRLTVSLLPLLAAIRREDARELRAACRNARAQERSNISAQLRAEGNKLRLALYERRIAPTNRHRLRAKVFDDVATVIDNADDKPTPVEDD